MSTLIPPFSRPELFFGFVAPIGVDVQGCVDILKEKLDNMGYITVEIKVTDIFQKLKDYIEPEIELKTTPEYQRYGAYIKYGNKLRTCFEDDAAVAVLTIARLIRLRINTVDRNGEKPEPVLNIAFIMHQFKRKEEIDLLRSLYGEQFFQISVYWRRGARVDYLSTRFANTANSANRNEFRSAAERIVQIDYNESSDEHGQKIVKIFHDGDFILNIDRDIQLVSHQI
jgi:hypothetical protein